MCQCVLVGVWPCRGLGEGDDLRRSLAVKPFHVALRNELRKRGLPGLLPMGGEPATFLRVQPQLTRHLDMQIAQVKPSLGFRPGVETGFRLLHDVFFPLQTRGLDGQRAGAKTGIPHQACGAPRTPRSPDAPLPAVYASAYQRVRELFHAEQASPARDRWRAVGPPAAAAAGGATPRPATSVYLSCGVPVSPVFLCSRLLGILLLAAFLHLLAQQAGCATHTSGGSSFPGATGFLQLLWTTRRCAGVALPSAAASWPCAPYVPYRRVGARIQRVTCVLHGTRQA